MSRRELDIRKNIIIASFIGVLACVATTACTAITTLPAQNYENLKNADWIAAGAAHPSRIIYVFLDPNCPYCHEFWKQAQNYYGKRIQVRYIVVAKLGKSSLHKAAAILAADDPATALRLNESRFSHHSGGIRPIEKIPDSVHSLILKHNALMRELGFYGVPAIVWIGNDGGVKALPGLPSRSLLATIFGVSPD